MTALIVPQILQEKGMRKLVVAVLALAFMMGCTSSPTPTAPAEKPAPKAPQTLTGRSAITKCYIAARGWAPDAKPFRLESEITPDANGKDGKATSWRASFASPAGHGAKPFIWANGEVSPGTEDNYSPTNTSTQVFDIQFLKIDSDQALDTAQKHGGDKVLETTPDTPILYVLSWDRATSSLYWHVIYGTDRDSAKLRVAVNASTGEFVKIEK
jgi:hypothetical protein